MAHARSSSSSESLTLPPINLLFAEVLQRQRAEPSHPPVRRRPSAWPGFPGPDKNALSSSSGYLNASPPPPLQIGRRPSAPSLSSRASSRAPDVLISPSIFTFDARDEYMTQRNPPSIEANRPTNQSSRSQSSRSRPQSWSDLQPSQNAPTESGRLPPIAMATGSPRLYERETSRSSMRDSTCQHCMMDRKIEEQRATAATRPGSSESPYAFKQQIPTPLPPTHGHTMIQFQPTPSAYSRSFGVAMADILECRPCLKDPDTPVLDNGLEEIYLTLEAKGYSTLVLPISSNCLHRRISRYNLAYAVASQFDHFFRESFFNPHIIKAAAIVVRHIGELRLVNLYSRDGKTWRVHVAYMT
ncbi:hypothetical protein R3P38DRAFT_2618648 [Favolaschia claudopus]|uniref:Uncharacterized protein n=1 Tax=Favolaschia claudopus TaxID=2862362 RepID=A0AAW0C0R3_9AGAR